MLDTRNNGACPATTTLTISAHYLETFINLTSPLINPELLINRYHLYYSLKRGQNFGLVLMQIASHRLVFQ